jgi:NDP-sugar pyrophosphorylase family protein
VRIGSIVMVGSWDDNDDFTSSSFCPTGVPLSLLPVVGDSVLHSAVRRLRQLGSHPISVITHRVQSSVSCAWGLPQSELNWYSAVWDVRSAIQRLLFHYAGNGVDTILLMRLGAYAELDLQDFVQFHRQQDRPISIACDPQGPLDVAVLDASRVMTGAALIGNRLKPDGMAFSPYNFAGYVNRLSSLAEFRNLSRDALMGHCQLRPNGMQIRPGVWVGEGVELERGSRLIAPVYIGAQSTIRAGALITRCSTVEHHSEVDCETGVENSSLLPHTYVGAGLEVRHSVVDGNRLMNLDRGVELEFADERLFARLRSRSVSLWSGRAAGHRGSADRLLGLLAPARYPDSAPLGIGEVVSTT